MTIGSNFFALGSNIMIDNFDTKSSHCNIIRRNETLETKPALCYDDGEPFDITIFASLIGYYFTFHPYLQPKNDVRSDLISVWNSYNSDGEKGNFIESKEARRYLV